MLSELTWHDESLLNQLVVYKFPLVLNAVLNSLPLAVEVTVDLQPIESLMDIKFEQLPDVSIQRTVTTYQEFHDIVENFCFIYQVSSEQGDKHLRGLAYSCGEVLFKILLLLIPDDTNLYLQLGLYRLDSGYEELAIEILERAVGIDPNYVEAHTLLCAAEYLSGNHELALQHFEKAYSLDPEKIAASKDIGTWAEIVLEFLKEEKRIEDYLHIFALKAVQEEQFLHALQSDIGYASEVSLSIDEDGEKRTASFQGADSTEESKDFTDLIKLSEWLRTQPKEVKERIAERIWETKQRKNN